MRRTRKRVFFTDPFNDRTERAACYLVSPYQSLVWRESFEALTREERILITDGDKMIPGFSVAFGAELVHRLMSDPMREIPEAERSPAAALRGHLHTTVPVLDTLRESTVHRSYESGNMAAQIMVSLAAYLKDRADSKGETEDQERKAAEQQALQDLGLDGGAPGDGGSASGSGGAGGATGQSAGLSPDQVQAIEKASAAAQDALDPHSLTYYMQSAIDAHAPPRPMSADTWKTPAQAYGGAEQAAGLRSKQVTGPEHTAESHASDLNLATVAAAHPDLRRVLELAGRLMPILDRMGDDKRAREGVGRSRLEVTHDFANLTTHEKAGLAGIRGGMVAADTYRRVLEGSALGYQGQDPRGQGPIVLVLDQSGSMTDDSPNMQGDNSKTNKLSWTRAVALSIVIRASRQGRRVAVVPYDSNVDPSFVRAWTKKPSAFQAGEAISNFTGGGTGWRAGLSAALDLIQYAAHGRMKRADIIHVTDGFPNDQDTNNESIVRGVRMRAKELNTRIHGIAVGSHAIRIANDDKSILAQWSDTICAVTDASHDSAAVQALGKI